MTPSAKQAQVEQVRDRFTKMVSAVLVDFRGLDVETVTSLRARFREVGVECKVVKNNLVRKALADSHLGDDEAFTAHLKGPTAIAWSYEDPSAPAKVLREFRKERAEKLAPKGQPEKLIVKCALVGNELLEAKRVETELASLPGKDELRASLLGQLMAPMQKLVMQLNAPAQNTALVLDAFRRKQEGGA
ncbi:MAG: 50S ribosomal protein L10 [Myxococcales bacterium]|nr:50S ribosomal protein L10 [Myxococcales bacterium]